MRLVLLAALLCGCHHDSEPPHHPGEASQPEEQYGATIEDDEAWNLARPGRCKEATRQTDCTGVREYVADFPKGKHAAEAKYLLDMLPARLEGVPEETRWDAADAAACKRADDVESCEDVESYLAKYPMGKHAAEARAVIDGAKATIEQRKKTLEDTGVDIEILGTDHSGKDCPPLLDDKEHHALCVVLDVRVRRPLKLQALGVMTDCAVEKGKPKKLYWATGKDLTKVPIGNSIDMHVAVPRDKRCTLEVGIGNIPKLEKEGLRRLCLIAGEDPKDDRAEPGSCGNPP